MNRVTVEIVPWEKIDVAAVNKWLDYLKKTYPASTIVLDNNQIPAGKVVFTLEADASPRDIARAVTSSGTALRPFSIKEITLR